MSEQFAFDPKRERRCSAWMRDDEPRDTHASRSYVDRATGRYFDKLNREFALYLCRTGKMSFHQRIKPRA